MLNFTTLNFNKTGNGKIDRTPLRVCRLLCFTQEVYRSIVRECKWLKKKGLAPSSLKKQKLSTTQCVTARESYKRIESITLYEPTDMWRTRESEFWQWRRVREWFREFSEEYSTY